MESELISLSPRFHFFFTFPFSLGFSIEYTSRPQRISRLERVAVALNANYPQYAWAMEPFNQALPLSLKAKGGIIKGTPAKKTKIGKVVEGAFEQVSIEASFDGRIDENIVYFDHGVGSVNLLIYATLKKVEAIEQLQQIAMAIIGEIRKDDEAIHIFGDWTRFRQGMLNSFRGVGVLYDMWGILGGGGEGREPTRYVGENAILRTSEEGPFRIRTEEIPRVLSSFTGLEPEQNVNYAAFAPGIVYLAEGWDGQIAIISNPNRETWLMDLWQFATDYGTVLHDLDRYLYARTLALRKQTEHIDLAQARREMDAIRRIELSIDVITHEILPHNFGGIMEEIEVYRGIYESWRMDAIAQSLKNKFNSLSTMFSNISSMVSNSMQQMMNWILLVFTILTFSGVLASVISTIDFDHILWNKKLRIFIISFGTLLVAIGSIVSYIIRRARVKYGN